ncbi:18S rRNA maturation protein [Podila epigama]|nr:18S rRNA maturation protein [Podila epigama]
MPADKKKVVNPEKEMRGKKAYNRTHGNGKKKPYQLKPKKLDEGEVPEGAAALKKKLRDTLRLIAKSPKMPADLLLEHQRRIEALKLQLADKQVNLTEQKMQTKYRMVKFIESQKASRKISSFRKQRPDWNNNPEEKAALAELELDFAYIQHFPRTQKYVSLYPGENAEDPKSAEIRQTIRKQIKEKLASGDITQFDKQVRDEAKEKILKKDAVPTEEAVQQTAKKLAKSKLRALQESDNPQLAARAKATEMALST